MACYAIQIKLAFLSYTSFTDHCWISPQLIVHLYSEDMYTCITPPTWSSLHGCTLGGILPLFISGIYQRPVLSSSMCQVLSHNQLMYMMKHLIVELPYQELVTLYCLVISSQVPLMDLGPGFHLLRWCESVYAII